MNVLAVSRHIRRGAGGGALSACQRTSLFGKRWTDAIREHPVMAHGMVHERAAEADVGDARLRCGACRRGAGGRRLERRDASGLALKSTNHAIS